MLILFIFALSSLPFVLLFPDFLDFSFLLSFRLLLYLMYVGVFDGRALPYLDGFRQCKFDFSVFVSFYHL